MVFCSSKGFGPLVCLLFFLHFQSASARRVADDTVLTGGEEEASVGENLSAFMSPSVFSVDAGVPASAKPEGTFKVMQYNILAKALGDNKAPWFLFGAGLSKEERNGVQARHDARNATTKEFLYKGFENYAADLPLEKKQKIAERSAEVFDWYGKEGRLGRGERLAKEIGETLADIVILEEVDLFSNTTKGNRFEAGLFSMVDKYACEKLNISDELSQRARVLSAVRHREARMEGTVYGGFLARRERRPDGAAILWRKDRFRLLGKDRVVYSSGDRIFAMVLLEDLVTGKSVLVLGTHLERNPENSTKEDTRRQQVIELVRSLRKVSGNKYDAVIVAGDMNSNALQDKWEVAVELFNTHVDAPPFADAFEQIASTGKKICTSRTEERLVLIDYIFYSPHTLRLVDKYGPDRCPVAAIPDEEHPSDHIPLVVAFDWAASPAGETKARKWGVFHGAKLFGSLEKPMKSAGDQAKAVASKIGRKKKLLWQGRLLESRHRRTQRLIPEDKLAQAAMKVAGLASMHQDVQTPNPLQVVQIPGLQRTDGMPEINDKI